MTPPASSIGLWAKIAGAPKDWPLWLLVGVALSLTAIFVVPELNTLVSPSARGAVLFATIAAWILTLCRSVPHSVEAWRLWRTNRETRVKFVITPIDHQCFWGVSRQADGSVVTQVSGHFMVKNRTAAGLQLMKARLVKPRISGEVLPGLVTMRAVNSKMHGTAHVSGHAIPPHGSLPVSVTILIAGAPHQKTGMMEAVLEIADADANKERIKLTLLCINAGALRPEPAAKESAAL